MADFFNRATDERKRMLEEQMTVYKSDEPTDEERLQAALDEGKMLGIVKPDFDIDQLLDEIERCEGCQANPNLTPLDHWGHRQREAPAQ